MNLKKFLLISVICININVFASPLDGADSVSDYLMISTEQQKIPLRRFLDSNKEIMDHCFPGWNLDKANDYFIAWVNDNPQYIRRRITSAFSDALFDACKAQKKNNAQ